MGRHRGQAQSTRAIEDLHVPHKARSDVHARQIKRTRNTAYRNICTEFRLLVLKSKCGMPTKVVEHCAEILWGFQITVNHLDIVLRTNVRREL